MNAATEQSVDAQKFWTRVRNEVQHAVSYQRGLVDGLREALRSCIRIRFGRPAPEIEAALGWVEDPEILRHVLYAVEFAPNAHAVWVLIQPLTPSGREETRRA